jgi:hypothetical protein
MNTLYDIREESSDRFIVYFVRIAIFFQINEMKKGYKKANSSIYTWQTQPNDKYWNALGVVLCVVGIAQLIPGWYRLATGKGKIE